jgi:hypothetical protein
MLPQTAWGFILYFANQARWPFIALLIVGGLVGAIDAALYWSVGWLIDILDGSTRRRCCATTGISSWGWRFCCWWCARS